MSAPAFTPGPWEARGGSLHRKHWLIDAPARRFIATIDGPPDAEGEANARLIAAAPKLYAFVAEVAKRDPVFAKGDDKRIIADAISLCAKARGEQ